MVDGHGVLYQRVVAGSVVVSVVLWLPRFVGTGEGTVFLDVLCRCRQGEHQDDDDEDEGGVWCVKWSHYALIIRSLQVALHLFSVLQR